MGKKVEGKEHTVGDGTTESSGKGEPDLLKEMVGRDKDGINSDQEEEELRDKKSETTDGIVSICLYPTRKEDKLMIPRAFLPRVQINSSRVGRSGILDNLLSILQLVVSLVPDLVGQLGSLDLQLLSLGLSLSGRVVNLFTDGRDGEGGREEGVGVVSSGSHFG